MRPLLVLYRLKAASVGGARSPTVWPYRTTLEACGTAWRCVAAVLYRGDGQSGHYCCVVETHHGSLLYDDLKRDGRMWQVGRMDDTFFHNYADDSSDWYIQEAIYMQVRGVADYRTILAMAEVLMRKDAGLVDFTEDIWAGCYNFNGRNVFGKEPPGRRTHPDNRNVPLDADGYHKYCAQCGDGGELHMCSNNAASGCGRVYHDDDACFVPRPYDRPVPEVPWECPVCQKAKTDASKGYEPSMLTEVPGKVPDIRSPSRDRFELRRTRALKQFDEYLHSFRSWAPGIQQNTGSTVRHLRTVWMVKDVMLTATSKEYGHWAGTAFAVDVPEGVLCLSYGDWHLWRGTGRAKDQTAVHAAEGVQVDDDERDTSGPSPLELFGPSTGGTTSGTVSRDSKRRYKLVYDSEDEHVDIDLLCQADEGVRLVARRRVLEAAKPAEECSAGTMGCCESPDSDAMDLETERTTQKKPHKHGDSKRVKKHASKNKRKQRKTVLDLQGVDPRWECRRQKGPKRMRQQQRRGSGGNYEVVTRTVARD